jgi:hypothetical protein
MRNSRSRIRSLLAHSPRAYLTLLAVAGGLLASMVTLHGTVEADEFPYYHCVQANANCYDPITANCANEPGGFYCNINNPNQGGCVSTPTYPNNTCVLTYNTVVCDPEHNCSDGVIRTVNNVPVPCPNGPFTNCSDTT